MAVEAQDEKAKRVADRFFAAQMASEEQESQEAERNSAMAQRVANRFFGDDAEQVVEQRLDANYDPENVADTKLRVSLASGDTLEEKTLRLQKRYPEGQLQIINPSQRLTGVDESLPDKDVMLFRESPTEQWKLVEPPGFDFTDVLEAVAPSGEAILGETAAAVLTGGQSIFGTVSRMALGAFVGEAAEQAIQSMRGVQSQSFFDQLTESGLEGGFSLAGGLAMSPFVGITNITRGAGVLRVGDEGVETLRAANALGVEDLMTPGLVADFPVVKISENQARSLIPNVQRRYNELAQSVALTLRKGAKNGRAFAAMDEVVGSLQRESQRHVRRLQAQATRASEGGEALQKGIAEYDLAQNKLVGDLYETARSFGEPELDYTNLTNAMRDIELGVRGKINPKVQGLINDVRNIKGPIELSDGSVVSVVDQLRNIRTESFALKHVAPGEVTDLSKAQAGILFRNIDETLRNPLNADTGFKRAWEAANNAARDRFTTLEKLAVMKVAKSENPAELVSQFAKPGQVGNLVTLRDTMGSMRWKTFTSAWKSKVLEDPLNVTKMLDSFDQETLNVLIPRAEQKLWRKVGTELDRIGQVGADKLAENAVNNRRFVSDLIAASNPRVTNTIKTAIANSGSKANVDSFRSAIYDWATQNLLETKGNQVVFKKDILANNIKKLKEIDAWGFLTSDQRAALSNARVIERSIRTVNDAGTSIRAAEIGAGLARLEAGAIKGFIQSNLVSSFNLSPLGRKLLIGSGKANTQGEYLRLLGAVLAQTSRTEDLTQLKLDAENKEEQ